MNIGSNLKSSMVDALTRILLSYAAANGVTADAQDTAQLVEDVLFGSRQMLTAYDRKLTIAEDVVYTIVGRFQARVFSDLSPQAVHERQATTDTACRQIRAVLFEAERPVTAPA